MLAASSQNVRLSNNIFDGFRTGFISVLVWAIQNDWDPLKKGKRERMRHSAYIASHCRGDTSYYWRPMEVTPVTAPERARLMPISTK